MPAPGNHDVATGPDAPKRWSFIQFPKIHDPRGNLTPIEGNVHIGFDIKRVYYIYDVPTGSVRAAHAHRKLHQLYVALAGSFELHLDDGYRQETLFLNRPDVGPHVRSGVWRLINNFSGAALCVVLASEPYDEADYIRSYEEFRRYVAGNAASPAGPQ